MRAPALVLSVLFAVTSCGDDGESGVGGSPGGGSGGEGGDGRAGSGGEAGAGGDGGGAPSTGTIALTLAADQGDSNGALVSVAVPFPPGTLRDPALVLVRDHTGAEVAVNTRTLATWPRDGSLRAVLLVFRADVPRTETRTWSIEYGAPRTLQGDATRPAPDGPVAATLDPSWYVDAGHLGPNVALADAAFPGWETAVEEELEGMDPPWRSYGLSCQSTTAERTYYDSPHALYQRFVHRADAASYRRAREEALWYRANELEWYANGEVALYACADEFDPASPLVWSDMRRMLGQGMLDDYLTTGDEDALAAVRGLGEAFRRNLVALTTGREITVRVTERNLAWPLMGLAAYYAVDPRPDVRAALDALVQVAIDWQAEGDSGAFEHDVVRPDPEECGDGPRGGSPFMTSLLIDGLMDAYVLTGDERICGVALRAAAWLRDDAITSDGVAFRYLWGCDDNDYDDSSTADLNLLIVHVFGAAYTCSGDEAWLDFGDTMAAHGVDNIYVGRPKQWSQAARSFLKYQGYRAAAREP